MQSSFAGRCPCIHCCLSLRDVLCPSRLSLGSLFWKWICSSAVLWQWEMEGELNLLSLGLPAGKREKEGREQGRRQESRRVCVLIAWATSMGNVIAAEEKC